MARKSDIRGKARAAFDHLMASMEAPDERRGTQHLREAVEHLADAAGILPEGKSLREVAAEARPAAGGGGLLRTLGLLDGDADVDVPLRERDYDTSERIALAKQGKAIPVRNDRGEIVHARYPITSRCDVENAVNDANRTGAGRKVKAHIIRNAGDVGARDLIPADWAGKAGKKGKARESEPLTLRERMIVGDVGLLDGMSGDVAQDPRIGLLDRMNLDRDELNPADYLR